MKFALIASAGLAITAGANANQAFTAAGPFALTGTDAAVTLFSSGGASFGTLGLFTFSFTYADTNSSWASDMVITLSDGVNTASLGGYPGPAPAPNGFAYSFQGSGSDPNGVYGDAINVGALGIDGANLTVTIVNGWAADTSANTISNFSGVLGGIVPTPGAMGLFGIAGLAAIRRRR